MKKLRGEVPDVYTYDDIPEPLRVQILHIWEYAIGRIIFSTMSRSPINDLYKSIVEILRHEFGLLTLPGNRDTRFDYSEREELVDFFLSESDPEKVLTVIELSFYMIDTKTRRREYLGTDNANEVAVEAIDELNYRFKEHGVGFQFINGQLIRIDSELIHEEIVKPALALLHNKEFTGAEQEFLKAHEHYRHGNSKEAMNECLKAFESTMRVICDKRKWAYASNARSKDLIKVCFEKELVPTFWQSQFTALRSLLESGIPTGRNNVSGHGQGSTPTDVPPYVVGFMLHMTASAIVFLVEAEQHLA